MRDVISLPSPARAHARNFSPFTEGWRIRAMKQHTQDKSVGSHPMFIAPPPGLDPYLPAGEVLVNNAQPKINFVTDVSPPPGLELPSARDISANRGQPMINLGTYVTPPPGLELPSAVEIIADHSQHKINLRNNANNMGSNDVVGSSLSNEMKADIKMKLDSGMSGCQIVEGFGPKWRNSVRSYVNEVGSCLSADMKAYIKLMLDSGKSSVEILTEFGPKWHASVKKHLDEAVGEETMSSKRDPPLEVCNIDPSLCSGAPLLQRESAIATRVQALTLEGSLTCGGTFSVQWPIDARKLSSKDKQIVSPEFLIDIPEFGLQPFKMAIYPTTINHSKCGAGFKKAKGFGRVEIKCVGKTQDMMPPMVFHIGVGEGAVQQPTRGPIQHNFAHQSTCCLPKDIEEWDFSSAIHMESKTFTVGLVCNLRAK